MDNYWQRDTTVTGTKVSPPVWSQTAQTKNNRNQPQVVEVNFKPLIRFVLTVASIPLIIGFVSWLAFWGLFAMAYNTNDNKIQRQAVCMSSGLHTHHECWLRAGSPTGNGPASEN